MICSCQVMCLKPAGVCIVVLLWLQLLVVWAEGLFTPFLHGHLQHTSSGALKDKPMGKLLRHPVRWAGSDPCNWLTASNCSWLTHTRGHMKALSSRVHGAPALHASRTSGMLTLKGPWLSAKGRDTTPWALSGLSGSSTQQTALRSLYVVEPDNCMWRAADIRHLLREGFVTPYNQPRAMHPRLFRCMQSAYWREWHHGHLRTLDRCARAQRAQPPVNDARRIPCFSCHFMA